MKKLLLSLVGILCSMSMWAAVTYHQPSSSTEVFYTTSSNCTAARNNGNGWVDYGTGFTASTGACKPQYDPETDNLYTGTEIKTRDGLQVKNSGAKLVYFYVTGINSVKAYVNAQASTGAWLKMTIKDMSASNPNADVVVNSTAKLTRTTSEILTATNLDENRNYRITVCGYADDNGAMGSSTSDGYLYAIKLIAPASGKAASNFTLTSASELVLAPSATSQITTTGNAGTISYTSGATSIATVSNTGLITAVAGGTTAISISDPGSSEVEGKNLSVTVNTLYAEDKVSSTFKFDNAGYFLTNDGNWYFKNGWSISTDQGFQYAALNCNELANNGFKVSAGRIYTINVPAGVTIRSARVTMRNNYPEDNGNGGTNAAANWGTIFGQDLSSETLPYSNEEAITKEFEITNETPMTFTPGGNQCQMYIELSTEALKQNSDLTLSSNTANVVKDKTTTVTFTSSSTGAVTATSSKTSVATVVVDGNNIEITGVAGGTATITVTQAADATYKAGEQTIAVTVTDPTAPIVLFDALNKVGSTDAVGTATVAGSGMFTFANGIDPNSFGTPVNYVKIVPANGSFKAGDVIDFTAYINNKDAEKVGYLAIVAPNDQETTVLFTSEQLKNLNSQGSNYAKEAVPQSYTLTEDYESLYIARAASGNTSTYVYGLTVSRAATASINTTVVGAAEKAYATFCGSRNFTATAGTIYKAAVNGEVVALTCVNPTGDEIIPASEGVIIATNGSSSVNVTYPVAASATANMNGNELQGTTSRIETPANCMALNATAGEFQSYTGAYFPANKAYLVVNAASAKNMRVVFGNATGIKTVNAEKVANAKFIENGRIVIVKDGAKYNVAGQVIK